MTDLVLPSATGRVIAPGFNPSDEELISYLNRKVLGKPMILDAIEVVDVYNHEDPSDLPEQSRLKSKDQDCFFFTNLQNYGEERATNVGYWDHQRGADKEVKRLGDGEVIGKIKRLVFNRGLPPNNQPTNWVIHEYHLVDYHNAPHGLKTDAYVLCRLSHSSGNIINTPFSEQERGGDGRRPLVPSLVLAKTVDQDDACLPQCVLNKEAPLPFIQYKRKRQIDSSFGSGYDDNSSQTTHQDSIPSVAPMLEEIEELDKLEQEQGTMFLK